MVSSLHADNESAAMAPKRIGNWIFLFIYKYFGENEDINLNGKYITLL
jgi:hypothetical protein